MSDDPRRVALAEAAGRQFGLVPGWLDVLDARELAELLALAPDFGARYGMGGGSGREMPVPFAAVREMFTGHPVIHAAVNLVAQIVADTEWEIQFAGRGADPDTGRDAARFFASPNQFQDGRDLLYQCAIEIVMADSLVLYRGRGVDWRGGGATRFMEIADAAQITPAPRRLGVSRLPEVAALNLPADKADAVALSVLGFEFDRLGVARVVMMPGGKTMAGRVRDTLKGLFDVILMAEFPDADPEWCWGEALEDVVADDLAAKTEAARNLITPYPMPFTLGVAPVSGVAVRIWLEDCAEPCLMTFPAAPSPGDVIRVKWDGAQRTQRVRHVEWVIVYTDVDLNVVCEKP